MRSSSPVLLLSLVLAGCVDERGPTAPTVEQSVLSLLGGLEVGEAMLLSGEQAARVFLSGGPQGTEHIYIPFFASEGGQAHLPVELTGQNVLGTTRTNSARAAFSAGGPFAAGLNRMPDPGFHHRLHERVALELGPRMREARSLVPDGRLPSRSLSAAAAPPQVGAILPLSVATSCVAQDVRHGRVEAVSRTAIIVSDTANPAGGFNTEDFQSFGQLFDELIDPVVTRNFNAPTDIDANSRVVVFFTRAVNEFTPPGSRGFVAGFFWAGDLFPRQLCPQSNQAEMFYLLAPDPSGVVNGNVFRTEDVRWITPGTLGHEYQHLINAGRRLYENAALDWEETWLDEGLSHMAEELLFYAASGLGPRQNVDLNDLVGTQRVLDAVNTYQVSNLVRLAFYLEHPQEESVIGMDNLETRGATWAFLRYVADHDEKADDELFRALVDSRYSGVENLTRTLEADPIDLMQAWSVAVYADDQIRRAEPRFQQPSWDFRDILPVFYFDEKFPLQVYQLGEGEGVRLRLRGGGAGFVRVRGESASHATVSATSGGRVPPERLRISVIRVR